MASSTNTQVYGVLDMLEAKGPTTETERVYRKVKNMHKQLLSLCAIVDQRPGAASDEQIVISEQPPVFGSPPVLVSIPPSLQLSQRSWPLPRK